MIRKKTGRDDAVTDRKCESCGGALYVRYQFKRHGKTICGGCETLGEASRG